MQNEIKEKRSKDKFLEMREQEQSIEDNPIRYGREQYKKGKKDAIKQVKQTFIDLQNYCDEKDAPGILCYQKAIDVIERIEKTES